MSSYDILKIGGPADLFIEPTTMDELSFTLRTIHELQVPVTIIGCGSNILVKDGGIRGAVVSVRHMTQIMDCNDNVLCIVLLNIALEVYS